MFPQKNRISKTSFSEIMKNSRVVHGSAFSLRYLKKNDASLPRFAFVVSKKVSKLAVERNKIRRRGFHILREIITPAELLLQKNGFIGAFFAKKEIKNMTLEQIKTDIEILLKKSGII